MDRVLQFALSEQSYLYDALRILRTAKATGVMRVVAEQVNGRIAVSDGKPIAAHNGTTGSTGDTAVRELRKAGVGIYHFSPAQLPADLSGYAISQRFTERLEELSERARIKQFDAMYESFVAALPPEDQQLLNMFRQLEKDEERQVFIQTNPEFLQHGILSEEKLNVVRLYGQLNSEIDKRAFLKGNPRFHEVMMDAIGMSDDKRRELADAQYAIFDKSPEFAKFCQQLFGKTYPNLNEEQAIMLKGNFLRLATDHNRRAFATVNPLLDESAPVLRGEDVLPFVRLDEPAPEIDQLTEEEKLAALQLQAIDHIEKTPESDKPYLRLRDLLADEIEQPPPKKQISSKVGFAILAVVVLTVFAITQIKTATMTEQPAPISANSSPTLRSPFLVSAGDIHPHTTSATTSQSGTTQISVPSGGDADLQAADKLLSEGKPDQAATHLESYLQRNPNSVEVNIGLVRCYIAAKRKKKARMLCISLFKRLHFNKQDNYTLTQLWRECMQ